MQQTQYTDSDQPAKPLRPRRQRHIGQTLAALWGVLVLGAIAIGPLLAPSGAGAHEARAGTHRSPAAHAAVVGGTTAAPGTWPWAAFIADTQNNVACTGTVISPMLVLTAAHCVEDITTGLTQPASAFQVVTGRLDWANPSGGQLLDVARVIINPGYTLTSFGTDAALLVLAAPTTAPTIALATSNDAAALNAGTVASIAGWGDLSGTDTTGPSALQTGTTVLQSSSYCAAAEMTDEAPFDPTTDVCTLDTPTMSTAACHGDSGGPLVVNDAGQPLEIAVISRGDANCSPNDPTVFTTAAALSAWASDWEAQYPPPPPTAAVAAPLPAAATTHPTIGAYVGHTSQRAGRLSLTVTAANASITHLKLHFTMRCKHGPRIAAQTRTIPGSTPLSLLNTSGTWSWTFTRHYTNAKRQRFVVSGHLGGSGLATGTFVVTTAHNRCTTGRVSWTAKAQAA